jgi:hypothetical protein
MSGGGSTFSFADEKIMKTVDFSEEKFLFCARRGSRGLLQFDNVCRFPPLFPLWHNLK